MAQIFLSHSSHDRREALALKIWLESEGWKDEIFLDFDPVTGIKAGIRWKDALTHASSRAEALICLVSPEWTQSPECVAEYRTAENLGKRIFVAHIAELDSVDKTREWQGIRLFGNGLATEITLGPQDPPVRFMAEGLARLRNGLLAAGMSGILPRYFPWPPQDEPERAPYRGLEPLHVKDAGVYFGRDAEILQGLSELERMRLAGDAPLFIILGPSGSGKSSFLRAGLLPRLARDDRHFHTLEIIRPERSPLSGEWGLAQAISRANRDLRLTPINVGEIKVVLNEAGNFAQLLRNIQAAARAQLLALPDNAPPPVLLLPVDQAEELFSTDATEEACTFLALLGSVLRISLSEDQSKDQALALPLIVIFTIRSDRYEPLQTASELMGLKTVVFDALKPMPRVQFKEVITGPAKRATSGGRQLEVKPDLVQQLLTDCDQGADTLPLLSLTLSRLYRDYGNDGDLRLDEYHSMGGMSNVILTEIESILAVDLETRRAQLEMLHTAFIPWLATINPNNDQPMRRLARMTDLPPGSHSLIQALIEKRLLLSDMRDSEQVVEVAHESLLRQWDKLAEWLEEESEDLKEAGRLEQAAAAWDKSGRKLDWLLEGERLTISEVLLAKPGYGRRLESAAEFLLCSRQRETQRKEAEERQRKAELIAAQEKQKAAEEKQAAAEEQQRITERLAEAERKKAKSEVMAIVARETKDKTLSSMQLRKEINRHESVRRLGVGAGLFVLFIFILLFISLIRQ